MTSFLFPGDAGITQTVNAIQTAIHFSLRRAELEVRRRAEDLVASCPERSEICEVTRIYNWTLEHFRYTKDMAGIETVKSPEVIDQEITARGKFLGDCDDISGYMAALLKALGFSVRLVIIAPVNGDGKFSHIYLEAWLSKMKRWIALDGTARGRPLGWSAPAQRRRDFDV